MMNSIGRGGSEKRGSRDKTLPHVRGGSALKLLLVAGALLCLSFPHQAQSQTYTVLDLGAPPTGTDSEAHAINQVGSVAGIWWTLVSNGNGFLYQNGNNADLGILGAGKYSSALAMNDNSVVGQSSTNGGINAPYHAFLFANHLLTDLGALGDGSWSSANGINNSGLIVGETIIPSGEIHAAVFASGSIVDLGSLASGDYSTALGVNDSGVIIGESSVVTNGVTNTLAFLYTNNVMSTLSGLDGSPYSKAAAINNLGEIVGEYASTNGDTHAFLWSNGLVTDLGTLDGGNYSTATAINSSGQIVGYATDSNSVSHAFLYTGSTMVKLDTINPTNSAFASLGYAYGINDNGLIAGAGNTTSGHYQAFLLGPTQPTLMGPASYAQGQFELTLGGAPGLRFAVQYSSDLSSWTILSTNTFISNLATWRDPVATNNSGFYRILAVP
jgi:probable HAF family extracellular repeat protein